MCFYRVFVFQDGHGETQRTNDIIRKNVGLIGGSSIIKKDVGRPKPNDLVACYLPDRCTGRGACEFSYY